MTGVTAVRVYEFQSTRPRGARRREAAAHQGKLRISIHAPAWGATIGEHLRCSFLRFQSTRPRGARHGHGERSSHDRDISIHAPAWGATVKSKAPHSILLISIHAPAWGATTQRSTLPFASSYFNPRARVGRDFPTQLNMRRLLIFQSTRPRGARHKVLQDNTKIEGISIHAPAWGATAISAETASPVYDFNPRARVGRDAWCEVPFTKACISIHAPAWGATDCQRPRGRAPRISIHAPAWGATRKA